MTKQEKIKELALLEIGWWKDRHRNVWGFKDKMIKMHALLFSISIKDATKAVEEKIKAIELHNEAKILYDKGFHEGAEKLWTKAEREHLRKYIEILITAPKVKVSYKRSK